MSEQLPFKVFFIGFNKTGTVSYHNIMKSVVGDRAIHQAVWTDWAYCSSKDQLDKYDVFTDGECANIKNLDKLYPNAKYVLNTRPLEDWLVSRQKSMERSQKLNKWFFTRYLPVEFLLKYINSNLLDSGDSAMNRWVEIRDSYHYYVIDYFKNRESDLLVLELGDDNAVVKLQNFLKLKTQLTNHHKNTAGKGLKSGRLFDALGLQPRDDRSMRKVRGFLRRENLRIYKREKLYTARWEKKMLNIDVSKSSNPTKVARFFVKKRANSQSFLSRYFYDKIIKIVRGGINDMNRFVPVNKYAGGAK
ncbi:MAG: hypothetical protein GY816_16090 [Cytophagales bacterium]|nr:hypothetical protein [Cytophagales bacterium]